MSRIIDAYTDVNGIKFFTDPQEKLQIGIMERLKGHVVKPHYHNDTQEVLYIVYGVVRVTMDNEKHLAYAEDIIHLTKGVHSLEFLENARIIEIKQGPHKNDKVYV